VTEAGEDSRATWVGRATAQPSTDPWPTTEQPVYEVVPQPVPGQPIYVYPQPPRRRRGLTTFVIVAGVIAACCGAGATIALISSAAVRNAVGISTGNQDAQTTPAPAPTTPTRPPEPGLNTPVRDGKFEFVVTSVSCGHKSVGVGPISAKAKGRYCLVDLSVENVSSSGQLLLDGIQRGFDAEGTSYTPDSGAGVIANTGLSILISTIDPGQKVTGTIVFDVPNGVEITKLELHDSAFSQGATVTIV
jgi:Domain of unknown function (DUF4352)